MLVSGSGGAKQHTHKISDHGKQENSLSFLSFLHNVRLLATRRLHENSEPQRTRW